MVKNKLIILIKKESKKIAITTRIEIIFCPTREIIKWITIMKVAKIMKKVMKMSQSQNQWKT